MARLWLYNCCWLSLYAVKRLNPKLLSSSFPLQAAYNYLIPVNFPKILRGKKYIYIYPPIGEWASEIHLFNLRTQMSEQII